jgi:hypothetical protein
MCNIILLIYHLCGIVLFSYSLYVYFRFSPNPHTHLNPPFLFAFFICKAVFFLKEENTLKNGEDSITVSTVNQTFGA